MVRKRSSANDEAGIVLNYEDLYRTPVTIKAIKDILARFAFDDWLCQLARLTCILGGNRYREPEWAKAFLKYFTPPEEIGRVNQWFDEARKKGRHLVVPSERHVEILLELALVHAPDAAPRRMVFPGDERQVFDPLLMVATLATNVPKATVAQPDLFVPAIAALWLRALCPDPIDIAVRGYCTYEILRGSSKSTKAKEWASLFFKATGQDLDDYFCGGLGSLTLLLRQSVEDLAQCWQSVLSPASLNESPKLRRPIDAYASLRSADARTIKKAILTLEPGDDIGAYNLIPLRQYPLMHHKDGLFPLSLAGVANSLLDGVYHAIITASLKKRMHEGVRHVGGVFGTLYESQINELLRRKYGDRLIPCPKRRDNGNEAADALLLCDNGLVVFQIKGMHIPSKEKPLLRTSTTFEEYISKSGLTKAVAQLEDTIVCCRANTVIELPKHWSGTSIVIQPIIITYEPIPEYCLAQPLIKKITAGVQLDDRVRPAILMSTKDVENIVSLSHQTSLWSELTDYVISGMNGSFHNFLAGKCRDTTILSQRGSEMCNAVIAHLGLAQLQLPLPRSP